MRKYQQKQILESIKTLYEATAEIKRFLSRKNSHSVMQLLADCQEMAIKIGNYIESLEGEGTRTVLCLEEYCRLLYQSSVEIGDNKFDTKIDKQLQKQLVKIEDSVADELSPNRIEIAFISYKASMSDSIESIYLAAKADPNCDAIFLSVPYYDMNSDNSPGMMHYEGADCYGDNIEITDWQEYDIETRHPDVIFTFNPYDETNLVTRIHPNFYCCILREYTDLLVYVPYFATSGDLQEHFCVLPGCIYAHKVIVQSEKIRNTYVSVFKQTFGDRFGRAKDKFLALGSPKFDIALNTKREDCVLPEEWTNLIGDKKVVLYNTSIGAILQNNEQYLKKLRHVLEMFQKRDDVTLWWRPHPLSESTYASMRPGLLKEYQAIVADCKGEIENNMVEDKSVNNKTESNKQGNFIYEDSSQNGNREERKSAHLIYDDSAELNRAIAWADAYYGDLSSLVMLFGVTGKPIVIQDTSHIDDRFLLCFVDFGFDNNGEIWSYDYWGNGLFKLDFENNTAQFVMKSSDTKLNKEKPLPTYGKFVKICCIEDEIICFPHYFTDYVLIYNQKTKEAERIQIDCDYRLPSDYFGFAFRFTIEYNGNIYAFGALTKSIVVFNIKTHNVSYDKKLFEHIGLLTENEKRVKHLLYIGDCSVDGKVIFLMRNCEHLISYALETQEIEFIKTNPALTKCLLADYDGQSFWLITEKNKNIMKWNPNSNETTYYDMSSFDFSEDDNVFSGLLDCGDYILLLPGFGSMLLKFDKNTECFNEYTDMVNTFDDDSSGYKYDKSKRFENKIYTFFRLKNNYILYELDKLTNKVTPHTFYLDESSYELFYGDYFNNVLDIVKERNLGDIANFFAASISKEFIINNERRDEFLINSANKDGTAGKTIYDYICKVVKR